MAVPLKTKEELELMIEGGKISSGAMVEVLKNTREGVRLSDLDKIAEDYILSKGAEPSFKKVKGYIHTTCINLNEGIVHGIPNEKVIKKGDLVKIDLGAFYKGLHTDISHTVEVITNNEKAFLEAGKVALASAISQCQIGNRMGDVSFAIQKVIEDAGYTVSLDLIGHGVGRKLHEAPSVPGYGRPGTGLSLKEGLVLAIEVIYQKGNPTIAYEKDGWTIITKDRSLSGLFEHTVALTSEGPKVITAFDTSFLAENQLF